MKLISKIIQLRFLQSIRLIRETGLILLIALLVSMGFLFQLIDAIRTLNWIYIAGFGIISITTLHFNRKDLRFLAKIASQTIQVRLVLLMEYLLLLSPVILLFLLAGPQQNGFVLCFCPLIAFILPTRSFHLLERKRKKSVSWIPLPLFELKMHIEKNKVAYALLYGLSLLSPLHIGFLIVGIFFLSTLLLTAFSFYEPKELLRWEPHFLRKKLWQNLLFFGKAMIPIFILATVFHYPQWPLLIYLLLIPLLTITFGLLYKYARLTPLFYQPPNSTILSLFLILLLLPGGILIHLGYSLFLVRRAQKNLRHYYA